MKEDPHAVGGALDVTLDGVGPDGQGGSESRLGVFRIPSRKTPMGDDPHGSDRGKETSIYRIIVWARALGVRDWTPRTPVV